MGFIDDAKDKVKDVVEDAGHKAHDAGEDIKDWVDESKEKADDLEENTHGKDL